MKRTSFGQMNCSIAQCLEVVGEWWSMLIVRDALLGVRRFEEFQARLGIARNVLTARLEHLVEHDVFERAVYQQRPQRHEYQLTAKGRELWTVVVAMRQWGDRWAAPDGPPVQMIHTGCGEITTSVPTCANCAQPLHPADLQAIPGPGAASPAVLPATGTDGR